MICLCCDLTVTWYPSCRPKEAHVSNVMEVLKRVKLSDFNHFSHADLVITKRSPSWSFLVGGPSTSRRKIHGPLLLGPLEPTNAKTKSCSWDASSPASRMDRTVSCSAPRKGKRKKESEVQQLHLISIEVFTASRSSFITCFDNLVQWKNFQSAQKWRKDVRY